MSRKMHTTSQFVFSAKVVHGNRYDYSKTVYAGSNKKLIITCPDHGDFEQIATTHMAGSGCPECSKQSRSLTTEQFITKAKIKHSDRYDYSKTVYTGAHKKLIITCPDHGDFEQIAHNHLKGSGCPECSKQSTVEKRRVKMRYSDVVSNAKSLDKTIFDLTDEDFKNNKLVLADHLVVLGNSKGARCLINKDGTVVLNKTAKKQVETWLNNARAEETNWLCPVERVIKALGGHVIRYS